MKKGFILMLFMLSIGFTYGQSKNIKTVEIKTEISCDHCNKCNSCGQNIYNKLKKNKGIKSVKVDIKANIIFVKYNQKNISLEEIENSISNAGFNANNTLAKQDAYNKLDNCCKKK